MGPTNHANQAPQAAQEAPHQGLKADGYCHNCAVKVADEKLFCSPFCSTEWQRQSKHRAREGRSR